MSIAKKNASRLLWCVVAVEALYYCIALFWANKYLIYDFQLLSTWGLIRFLWGGCVFIAAVYLLSIVNYKYFTIRMRFFKPLVYIVSISLNIILSFYISNSFRYESGAISGYVGLIYVITHYSNIFFVVFMLREKHVSGQIDQKYFLMWAISFALRLDGLSSALFLFCFIVLIYIETINLKSILVFLFAAGVLGLVGFEKKMNGLDFDLQPIYSWIFSRFYIQTHQLVSYLNDSSIVNGTFYYWDLIFSSIGYRIDYILYGVIPMSSPKSISEAMFYDVWGTYDAGSSPGLFLDLFMQGPAAIITLLVIFYIFNKFFSDYKETVKIWQLPFYLYIFKELISNTGEFYAVISIMFGSLIAYYLAVTIKVD